MKWLRLALLWMMALCGSAEAHEITFSHVNVRLERDETLLWSAPVGPDSIRLLN